MLERGQAGTEKRPFGRTKKHDQTLRLKADPRDVPDAQPTACYNPVMQLADAETEFPTDEVTFEMSNLSPRETGLDFAVFVSPTMASHAARIKVTQPPWGSKPSAVYTIAPFGFAAGAAWLSKSQEDRLRLWVGANLAALLAYWGGGILYDQDLRAVLVPIDGDH